MAETQKGEKNPKILGVAEQKTEGLKDGYITSVRDTIHTLKKAIEQVEKHTEIKIKRATLGFSTSTLRGDVAFGSAVISKADGEVTALDINKALEEAENSINLINRRVIQVSPIAFKLDGKEITERPIGMHGNKIEVKALVISASNQHIDDLLEVALKCGIDVADIVPGALAGSHFSISQREKMVGCMVLDIGGETTSLAVFENGCLISFSTFPIGTEDITNDIALGLKVSLENAEKIRLGELPENYSRRKVEEIIEARLADIFESVDNHLKKIKRSGLLPAGVILVGGGANIKEIDILSKDYLRLPSKIGSSEIFGHIKTKLKDPIWLPVLGLINHEKGSSRYDEGKVNSFFKELKDWIRAFTKQLMP